LSEFEGQDICVLGGTGTIGTALIERLLKENPRRIRCVSNDEYSMWQAERRFGRAGDGNPIRYILKDLRNRHAMREVLRGVDLLYLLAAYKHVQYVEYSPQEAIEVNVVGNMNLIEEVLANARIQRVVNISCLDNETRIWTKDGLKQWDEVVAGAITLTLNQNGEIEEDAVEDVVSQAYSGDMIQIKTRSLDMMLTPNHKVLLQFPHNSSPLIEESASQSMKRACAWIPKGKWTGIDEAWFSLPIPSLKHFRGRTYTVRNCPAQVKTADLLYLLGIFIGDGFISESDAIFLDIPEKDKARMKVLTTLDNMGISYKCYTGRAGQHIYFSSRALAEVFSSCGRGAKNKTIPDWALRYSPRLLHSLFNGLIDSDGHRGSMTVLSSISPRLMEKCAELATKMGLHFTISIQKNKSISRIEGRVIHSRNAFLGLFSKPKSRRGFIRDHCKKVHYDGIIWCVRMKHNHNFLAERNGKFFFTGNTDKVCHAYSTYGLSKALVEKMIEWASFYRPREQRITSFANVRFGNVIGSRGSVLENWFSEDCKAITLRDATHRRFFMQTKDAIDLVLKCTAKMEGGETFIFKMPVVRMGDLAEAVSRMTGKEIVGVPHVEGEVQDQWLMTETESAHRMETKEGFILHRSYPSVAPTEYSTRSQTPLEQYDIMQLLEEWKK